MKDVMINSTNHRMAFMNRLKLSSVVVTVFFIVAFTSESYAASFNCDKASTLVEKAIFSDSQFSNLDDLLMQTYKKAMSNASDKKSLKHDQLTWLKSRNKCTDSDCIKNAYEERIKEIGTLSQQNKKSKDIVLGRCHMDSCWWWKVEKTENIQSESKGELIKVSVRTTTVEYSSSEIDKKGYPDLPPKKSRWEKASEAFVFCSKTLPAYIEYDKDKKVFTGTLFGATSGATEGIENLYSHICNSEIKSNAESSEINLEKPTDIFYK